MNNIPKLSSEELLMVIHDLLNNQGEEEFGTMYQMALYERKETKDDHLDGDKDV